MPAPQRICTSGIIKARTGLTVHTEHTNPGSKRLVRLRREFCLHKGTGSSWNILASDEADTRDEFWKAVLYQESKFPPPNHSFSH